jgi:transposase
MMVIGIDAHKRSHTAVMVDDNGREHSTKTVGTTTQDHLQLLKWAALIDGARVWAIEDCRHLTRRLERDLIAAGESVVRVPPKLMAHIRDSARTYGKSDPIDALAGARAALREPDLPVGRLDGVERELRLLVDHREDLVAERTRIISRLRWHLHELDPGWPGPAKMERTSAFNVVAAQLEICGDPSVVRRLALRLVEHLRMLTTEIDELAAEITERVIIVAPSLLAIVGCGALTAAKIVGETAQVHRFRSKAKTSQLWPPLDRGARDSPYRRARKCSGTSCFGSQDVDDGPRDFGSPLGVVCRVRVIELVVLADAGSDGESLAGYVAAKLGVGEVDVGHCAVVGRDCDLRGGDEDGRDAPQLPWCGDGDEDGGFAWYLLKQAFVV